MGLCLRGKMTEAGLLAPPPVAEVAETTGTPPAESEPADVAAAAVEAPEGGDVGAATLDVTPPEEAPSDLIAASFGLLRAEPDGSVVIAGSGTPGTEVEVYSDELLLGKTTVESSGDWVIVPDGPIAPGGSEITLAEAGKPGRAPQSFVVVINDDRTTQPLVVASTPGAISEVLQGMDPVEPETTTQVAVADPAATAPADPVAAQTPVAATDPVTPNEPAAPAEPAVIDTAAATAVDPAAQPAQAAASTSPAAEPAEVAAVAPETQETAPVASVPEPAAEPETAAAEVGVTPAVEDAAADAAEPETAVAAVASTEPAASTPAAPASSVAPTIDAIEIEGNRAFFAGAGPEGGTIRLYVDDAFIADAAVEDGRWLIESTNVLTNRQQRVRIDLLEAGSAQVAARAEVNFVVDLPEDVAVTAVAEAPQTPAPPVAPEAARPAASAEAQPAAVESPAQAASPEAEPAQVVAPETPVQAEPTSVAQPAPAAEPAETVPTLVGVAFGSPDAQRFSAGKAIIRRGDNLWTIARRVYGEGIKYTAIYDANTGQIRDPHRIYPGQVFELPN